MNEYVKYLEVNGVKILFDKLYVSDLAIFVYFKDSLICHISKLNIPFTKVKLLKNVTVPRENCYILKLLYFKLE